MNNVWLVSKGEMHEGSFVLAAFKTKKAAIKYAASIPTHRREGWEQKTSSNTVVTYTSGCDYVEIAKIEVK